MSKARLIITAVVIEGRSQAEVAREYQVSKGWVSKLVTRYRTEGDTAFEPRSRRPHTSPGALDPATVELIIELRHGLHAQGLEAGTDTIAWHLEHHHRTKVSTSTIHRYLRRAGSVTLRHNGKLHHIGIGRTHARTPVILLIADLDIRVIHAATGELLRHLTLDPTRDYQPTGKPPGPPPTKKPKKTEP